MSPRGCSFRLGASGWALGTRLDAGPVVVRGDHVNALRPDACRFVGPDDRYVGGAPTVRWTRGGVAHVAVGGEGAYVDGRLVAPGARHATLADGEGVSHVVIADPDGLARAPWSEVEARTEARDAVRWSRLGVDRGDVRALAATGSRERLLVLYALPDPILGVCFSAGGETRDVRLRLPAPVVHIDTEWVGEQTGYAVLLETGETYAGVLDARGISRVRPHALAPRRVDGRVPRVVWSNRGFRAIVPCTEDATVRVYELGKSSPELVVERVEGTPDAVCLGGRHHLVWVDDAGGGGDEAGGDAATIWIRSLTTRGEGGQLHRIPIRSPEHQARLRRRAMVDRLRGLASELRQGGYRGGAQGVDLREGELAIALSEPWRMLLAFELGGGDGGREARDALRIVRPTEAIDPGTTSFPRLRRWMGVPRTLELEEDAFVEQVRGAFPDYPIEVEVEPSAVVLRLALGELPAPGRLAAWLRGVTRAARES